MATQDNIRCASCYMAISDVFSRIMQDLISMHGKTPHEVYELVMNDPTFFKLLNKTELNMVNALRKGTFENLDQSIIYKIFKHFKAVKFVPTPINGWGKYPQGNETNIGDDVERMRFARNRFCHKTRSTTDEDEFDDFFTDFTNMCVRLDTHLNKNPIYGHQQAIRTLKTTTLSTDEAEKYLEDRQKVEDLKEELAIMTGQGKVIHIYIGKSIHEIKEKVRTLNAESTTPIKFIIEGVVDTDEEIRKIDELKANINNEQIDIQLQSVEKGSLTLIVKIKNKILQKEMSLVQTVAKFIYSITAMHTFIYKDEEEPNFVILPDESYEHPTPSTEKGEAMEASCDESGKDSLVLNLQVKNKVFQTDSLPQSLDNFLKDATKISDGRDLIRGNDLRAVVLPRNEESDEMTSVDNFLEEVGLHQLKELFERHEITMDKLLSISDEELQMIGLKDQTHIRIIMNALKKKKEENAVTFKYLLHQEKNESSSESSEYLSLDEEDIFPVLVEEMHDPMSHSLMPKRNDAQSPLISNNMEKKSDRVEASQASSGVTASEQTANLFEKITTFKRRANEHLIEIYKEICAFADSKQPYLFQDLKDELIIEFGDIKKVSKDKVEDVLDNSCPIVITGETAAGKSSFINLLLGVDLLPQSALACTSTICRIHNNNEKKIEVTGKLKGPKKLELEKKDVESVRNVLKAYVTIRGPTENQTCMDKEEDYEFVDIYWPIPFLQENIMIVDTPGIGPDHPRLTNRLFQYLPNALAFIYVINSSNAGGVQTDRILKIQDELLRIRGDDKTTVFDPRRAVFICNKWDLIYEDNKEVFVSIQNTLKENWRGFKDSKLLKLSAREEMRNTILSDDFRNILESIKSMVPATVDEKIRRHLQWQQYFFDRVLVKLSTRIRNTHRSKEEIQATVEIIEESVHKIKTDQDVLKKKLHNMAEQKCREISFDILNHLREKKTFSKMFDWTEEHLPKDESIDEIKKEIDKRIRAIVSVEIMTKMKRIEIESLSEFIEELFEWQQMAIDEECGELDRVFKGETDVNFSFDEHKIGTIFSRPNLSLAPEEKAILVVASPIWIPAGIIIGAVSAIILAPVTVFKKLKNHLENSKKVAAYNKEKIKYANEKAEKYLQKISFDSLFTQVQNGILKNINERIDRYFSDVIPKRIAAGELLIRNIEKDIRPPFEIRKRCHRVETEIMPIYGRLILAYMNLFEENLIPISKVRTPLTESSNHRNYCKAEHFFDGQWIPVHVSTITCAPDDKDKYAELAEIHLLRKLQHQNIVVHYGLSVVDGSSGSSFRVFTELCEWKLEDEILGKHMPWMSRKRCLSDALKGLAYLHQTGFVHKNIRLSNIWIKGSDAKLSSCGISEEVPRGTIKGIPIVIAPEVYIDSYCGCESDMFQFGVVIWEAWYCERAFCEEKWTFGTTYEEDFIHSVIQGDRPKFHDTCPKQLLVNVVKSCWDLDPSKRPSAERVLIELGKN